MKKMLFLIFSILFLTSGCYDYIELNNMAIVSGIAVDYKIDTFFVTFEVLNTKSKDDNKEDKKAYYASGSGSSLSEAFSNTTLEIAKTPYLAHLKTVIIDENIARFHVEEIVDFLIRDNHIRNIFYLVMAKDTTSENILKKTDTNNPVVSTAISDLIENITFTNNIVSNLNFEQFVMNIIDPKKDTYITTIEIQDDVLKLGPLGIFKEYKMQDFLTEEESATFNMMNNDSKEIHFKLNCPNDNKNYIILSTFGNSKTKINVKEKDVNISTEIETKIIENHCKFDFKEVKTYEELQKSLEEKLKQDMQQVMNKSFKYNSDILEIEHIYYQKNRTDIDFRALNYLYDAKVIINRNGLIFEVNNDE